MRGKNSGNTPKGEIISGDAVVVRLEPDGFGMIQDTKTRRFGVFTIQSLFDQRRPEPQLGEGEAQAKALRLSEAKAGLKAGASVHFVAEDKGELLNVTELQLSS